MKAPTSAFTFKTLLRHYAKRALTPRSLNVKLGPRRNYHKTQPVVELMEHYTALVQGLRPRHLYLICFMCGKDHHLSKIFDLLTMILYVRKYLIAKETLYVPTNILNSQRHVLLLQLTQLK